MNKKVNSMLKKIKKLGYKIQGKTDQLDPVCGMEVLNQEFYTSYEDILYNFCSVKCKQAFMLCPQNYINS